MEPTPAPRLFSPLQVAIATAIGSAPAGLWLAARNFEAAGRPESARKLRLWGFPISILLLIGLVSLPDKVPAQGGVIGMIIGAFQAIRTMNKDLLKASNGASEPASWRAVFAAGGISFVIILSVVVGVLMFTD